jgi:2-dehydro-3-deoxygalactonokinase
MSPLIALDWGTTSLRAARIAPDGSVREERHLGAQGILHVPPGGFPAVFAQALAGWDLAPGARVLACGMVGSRQGWIEAPYCPCPAGPADLVRALAWIPDAAPGVRLGLVPGLSTEDADGVPDVLRGEETQVLGALDLLGLADGLFVLPGTHSKWLTVRAGRITGFATAMTGEVYGLLRQQSILARTLPADDGPLDADAFVAGVRRAQSAGSLLRSAFGVRALSLFDRLPEAARPSYLSGLVIGEELRAQLAQAPDAAPVLVGSPALTDRYALALQALGRGSRAAPAATWRGLWRIAQALETAP